MKNEMKLVWLKPGDILVDERLRKDYGDIPELALSLKEDGELQPILIDKDCKLIAGGRRLMAHKALKTRMIPCVMTHVADPLRAQIAENLFRKEWSPDERVNILDLLTRKMRKRRGKKEWQRIARAVGWNPGTVRKAHTIVQASRKDPKRFGEFEARLRKTGKVDGAFKDLRNSIREEFGHETVYKGVTFRSTVEAKWAALFDLAGIQWEYEPSEFPTWTPDFLVWIDGEKRYVEVKAHTEFELLFHDLEKIEKARCGAQVWKVGGRMFSKWPPHPEKDQTSRIVGIVHDFEKEPDCATWRPLQAPLAWEEHWKSAATMVRWKPGKKKK